jgi:hypothetical protein
VLHTFLTSALHAGELKVLVPGRKNRSTYWVGGWVDPRCNLDITATRGTIVLPGNPILITAYSLVSLMTELSKLLS